ncbi:thermonuclease family protein, partial [Sphingobium sp.]|uniref:thermonuclease family protein n=1 Tax=Sphingobium sp. TaxID=1912891 RepID=UPI002CB8DA8F
DYRAGEASRVGLQAVLASGRVSIERVGRDDYGRTLAHIYVDDRDAGAYLVERGLARPWR